jgi:hypothetical protein
MQTSWAVQVYAEGRILRLAQSVDNVLFPIAAPEFGRTKGPGAASIHQLRRAHFEMLSNLAAAVDGSRSQLTDILRSLTFPAK